METKHEVKVFQINKVCERCKDNGSSIFTGTCFSAGHKKMFEHKCDKCGATEFFEIEYPFLEYEKINSMLEWKPVAGNDIGLINNVS